MSGLTAASVDGLVDAIKKTHANCLELRKFEAAHALADVLFVINRLREESTTQASRPDRVGDECWYAATSSTYRKGTLRAWFEDFAIVEDCETNRATQTHDVYFSTEAPK